MKRFLLKCGLFCSLNAGLGLGLLRWIEGRYEYRNWQTDSNLRIMPSRRRVDLLVLGTSHGRVFSRCRNHAKFEQALGLEVLNLSRGGGGGVVPAKIYLSLFYGRGNEATRLLYLIDPFVLYSSQWNEGRFVWDDEPLEMTALAQMVQHRIDADVIANYFKSKFSWEWLTQRPAALDALDFKHEKSMTHVVPEKVRKRIENMYPDGTRAETFEVYFKKLEQLIDLARDNGARRILLVTPPTLLGPVPGMERMVRAMNGILRSRPGVVYRDLSRAMSDPKYFYNHDHLNTKGIQQFSQMHLAPLLR